MATDKRVVLRKNGKPVKKFWVEKVSAKGRETFITIYPVYFTGEGDTMWSLTDEKAPRSLDEAIRMARIMVEAPDQPMTHANIYELRAVYRVGVEFDWKRHQKEQSAERAATEQQFRLTLISSTASS
jgi:hypothetical protein